MLPKNNVLIFSPTYNEVENIGPLFQRIHALGVAADILFLDDCSPDGTGQAMDKIANNHSYVTVIHRPTKQGIGTAHQEGIRYAYEKGYEFLITMDADFTHSPETIPNLIASANKADLVVASRFIQDESLKGWNLFRKFLTNTGHLVSKYLLNLPQDSTGAFRLYNLKTIPHVLFSNVRSKGYAFFFESMYVISRSHFNIKEIPVVLPPRTYGTSKMTYYEIYRSIKLLLILWTERLFKLGN